MSGNSFGKIFKITTFGESHGPALGVVIDGVPPNINIQQNDIQFELNKRKPGQSEVTTQRTEEDKVEILSGIFEGKTTGTPISMIIRNTDHNSADYSEIKNIFRPGHADFTYFKKFGIRDYRGGGRSSGRETVARVAAGAVAKKILNKHNINVIAYTLSIGEITAKKLDFATIEKNAVRTPDLKAAELMIQEIKKAQENNDSIGAIIEAQVRGCPAGLGDPVFDKLNARLSYALMSIGGIRAIEFGDGFKAAQMYGSQHNDKFYMDGDNVRSVSNHSGGISGGISNGSNIILRVAVKPTASISKVQQTVTTDNKDTSIEIKGRHDPCLAPRIVPVVESMIALTLVDSLLIQKMFKTNSDNL